MNPVWASRAEGRTLRRAESTPLASVLARLDQERRHGAAAASGDVQQRIGGDARQTTVHKLPLAHIGGRVEHALADLHASIDQRGKRLGRQRHPILNDVRGVQGRLHRLAPARIIDRPAQDDALAAVVVVGLENQTILVVDDEGNQVDRAALEGACGVPRRCASRECGRRPPLAARV